MEVELLGAAAPIKANKAVYLLGAALLCGLGLVGTRDSNAASVFKLSAESGFAVSLTQTEKKEWIPPANWSPSYESTGVYSWKPMGAAAEATPFRFKGKMYLMESVTGHTLDTPWPATEGGSYFRIVELESGNVVHCVKESVGHAFFSAVVDDVTGTVWVFGGAHNRGVEGKQPGGECDEGNPSAKNDGKGHPANGCYVGGWSSKDLTSWSKTFKSVQLGVGQSFYNNDVTLVKPKYTNWAEVHGTDLPPHQAAMALEASGMHTPGNFAIAINTGTGGDLSKAEDWKVIPHVLKLPEHACPALKYDSVRGDYYLTGGGHMQSLYRSRDLLKWQASAAPLTLNPVGLDMAGKSKLALMDAKIGPFMKSQWSTLPKERRAIATAYLKNISKWGWGVSDYDWCCDDGKAPTYMLYMVSTQGAPKAWSAVHASRGRFDEFQAMGTSKLPIVDWLRTHFEDETSNLVDMCNERKQALVARQRNKLYQSTHAAAGLPTYYSDVNWKEV